jgi:hypothetical protein
VQVGIAGDLRRDEATIDHHATRACGGGGVVQAAFRTDIEGGCLQVGEDVAEILRADRRNPSIGSRPGGQNWIDGKSLSRRWPTSKKRSTGHCLEGGALGLM